jgi:hypothetical protein
LSIAEYRDGDLLEEALDQCADVVNGAFSWDGSEAAVDSLKLRALNRKGEQKRKY